MQTYCYGVILCNKVVWFLTLVDKAQYHYLKKYFLRLAM